jgi:hypothetical protein
MIYSKVESSNREKMIYKVKVHALTVVDKTHQQQLDLLGKNRQQTYLNATWTALVLWKRMCTVSEHVFATSTNVL